VGRGQQGRGLREDLPNDTIMRSVAPESLVVGVLVFGETRLKPRRGLASTCQKLVASPWRSRFSELWKHEGERVLLYLRRTRCSKMNSAWPNMLRFLLHGVSEFNTSHTSLCLKSSMSDGPQVRGKISGS
jgi:hypothetical protein